MNSHGDLLRKLSPLALLALGACGSEIDSHSSAVVLTASCADGSTVDVDRLCPATRVFECDRDNPTNAEVLVDDLVCLEDPAFTLSHEQLDDVGSYNVSISVGQDPICAFAAEVVDTARPRVEVHHHSLWPPNHKMHTFDVLDCVTVHDACDRAPDARIVWATSDEPFDAQGDGNHQPDIVIANDRRAVDLRAERAGPKDGRVYQIGIEVTDASGNVTDATCNVSVPHDQSGTPAVDSGQAVRIEG